MAENEDDFDSWYETALRNGMGFKSDEERQEYIKNIGDLETHPLFAQDAEAMAGHPMAAAFAELREEEKTLLEKVELWKKEGNDWIKDLKDEKDEEKRKNIYREAYIRYSHALSFFKEIEEEEKKNEKKKAKETEEEKEKDKEKDKEEDKKEEREEDKKEEKEGDSILDSNSKILPPDLEENSTQKLTVLRSQIFSNRAMCSLALKNYHRVKQDCIEALNYWPGNDKAHYRKCKAIYDLRSYEECVRSCDIAINDLSITSCIGIGNTGNTGNTTSTSITTTQSKSKSKSKSDSKSMDEIKALRAQCLQIVSDKEEKLLASKRAKAQALNTEWINSWEIMQSTGVSSNLGYYSALTPEPVQMRDMLPRVEDGAVQWPILWLYPQHNQFDVVQSAGLDDMLVDHLSVMFPEREDCPGNAPIGWDTAGEYEVSKLVVYVQLAAGPLVGSMEQWIEACAEHRLLQHGVDDGFKIGDSVSDSDYDKVRDSSGSGGSERSERSERSRADEVKGVARERERSYLEELSKKYQRLSALPSKAGTSVMVPNYRELHLGCHMRQILTIPRNVLIGGVLRLLVFVRGNTAHQYFVNSVVRGNDSDSSASSTTSDSSTKIDTVFSGSSTVEHSSEKKKEIKKKEIKKKEIQVIMPKPVN